MRIIPMEPMPLWLLRCELIGDGEKLLYALLVNYCGKDGLCCPSDDTLALELGKADRTIRSYIKKLREVGLIETSTRYDNSNLFHFLEPPLETWQEIAKLEADYQVETWQDSANLEADCQESEQTWQDSANLAEDCRLAVYTDIPPTIRSKRDIDGSMSIFIGGEEIFETEWGTLPLTSAKQLLDELSGSDPDFKQFQALLNSERVPTRNEKHAAMLVLEDFLRQLGVKGSGPKFFGERQAVIEARDKWAELGLLLERHALALPPRNSPKALGETSGSEGAEEAQTNIQAAELINEIECYLVVEATLDADTEEIMRIADWIDDE